MYLQNCSRILLFQLNDGPSFGMALTILFFIFQRSILLSQAPPHSSSIENVNYSIEDSSMVIHYDILNAKANLRFNVSLKVIGDGNKIIVPKSYIGIPALGEGIKGGKEKTIVWDILRDEERLEGSYYVQLTAQETVLKRGPANALWSVLVPGLGDMRVRSGSRYHWVTIGTLGVVGTGLVASAISKKNYDRYLVVTEYDDLTKYYGRANNWHKASYILLGTGILAWGIDVIGVTIKGIKNAYENKASNYSSNRNIKFKIGGNYPSLAIHLIF